MRMQPTGQEQSPINGATILQATFSLCLVPAIVDATYAFGVDTQYAYPTTIIKGSTNPNVDAQVTTTAHYEFNTGVTLFTTDASGNETLFSYWSEPLRLHTVLGPAGGRVDR